MGDADVSEEKGGQVVVTGATDMTWVGRSGKLPTEGCDNLLLPHRLGGLLGGLRVVAVCGGPSACHALAIDAGGRLFSWGRNDNGQLGLGDTQSRVAPTEVALPAGAGAVAGSCGKAHTVVVLSDGGSVSFGSNKQGQLGVGELNAKTEDALTAVPVAAVPAECTAVACGAEFTLWLSSGDVYSAGLPQYGQLGHGTDNEYNMKEGSVKLAYEPQPKPKKIAAFPSKVDKIACGANHSIAIDVDGKFYTWGNGGYGRLGHKVQKDQFAPAHVQIMGGDRNKCPPHAVCAAGSTSTWVSAGPGDGMLFYFGKTKPTGEAQMYPNPYMELEGWKMRDFACGPTTFCATAETSVITWGNPAAGELGYGPTGPKSSAKPKLCDALEGMTVNKVAANVGSMIYLVDPKSPGFDALPVFEPPDVVLPSAGGGAGDGKRKGAPKAKAAPKKKAAK